MCVSVYVWKQCDSLSSLWCFLDEKMCLPSDVDVNKPDFQSVETGYIGPGHSTSYDEERLRIWAHLVQIPH